MTESYRFRLTRRLILVFSTLFSLSQSQETWATVPSRLEADYSTAVLAFHDKKYSETGRILDALIKKNPDIAEFQELKALLFKTTQKPDQAEAIYRNLIELKTKQNAPLAEVAAYHFELGVFDLQKKKINEAKAHFEVAESTGFNLGPTHYFLGTIAIQQSDWRKADRHLNKAIDAPIPELRSPAYFYLGQVYLKTGYGSGAVKSFYRATAYGKKTLKDPQASEESRKAARQIITASAEALRPLDQSHFFGSANVLIAYDTNVLALPDSISSNQATGKETPKFLYQMGIGYMSSPIKVVQFVPSYRFAYNYNTNRDSLFGEYITHLASVYINYRPLMPFNFGLKAEGNLTFQNKANPLIQRFSFEPYDLTGTAGPYVRYEFLPKWTAGLELEYDTQLFYAESLVSPDQRRTGFGWGGKVYIQSDGVNAYLTPSIGVYGKRTVTSGILYRTNTFGLTLSNNFEWNSNFKTLIAYDVSISSYSGTEPNLRKDSLHVVRIAPSYKLSKKFTALGEINYTFNNSNQAVSYKYNRWVISSGLSYNLF